MLSGVIRKSSVGYSSSLLVSGVRAASSSSTPFSPASLRTDSFTHGSPGHVCSHRCASTRGASGSQGGNRGVVYLGKAGQVEVRDVGYPKLELSEQGRKCEHGVILKVVATNICGSDQHMVRGRTTAPSGLVLGHEITGEVVECGRDVEFIKKGDLCSTPFNIACGRCANCKTGLTGICLSVNPARPGAAYGYVDMGGWVGGQAEYVMVPYADFNLLHLGPRDAAMNKILDLTVSRNGSGSEGSEREARGVAFYYVLGSGRTTRRSEVGVRFDLTASIA